MSNPNPNPFKPHLTLLSLPKEIHTLIFFHLPLSTALSLSYTCKTLHHASLPRVWSSLDLTLTPHFGEYPLTQTYAHGTDAHCRWAKGEATRAEERGRDEARRRVEELIRVGCKVGGLGLVRMVEVEQRKGVNIAIVQLLSFVREGVREITIRPPPVHVFQDEWKPAFPHTLFGKLHDFGMGGFQFTALRHFWITMSEYDFSNSLSLITNRAPLLEALTIMIPFPTTLHRLTKKHALYDTFKFPAFARMSNLRQLTIDTVYDTFDLPSAFLDILRNAPGLTRVVLSANFEDDRDVEEETEANFYDALRNLRDLDTLDWRWNTGRTFTDVLARSGFANLRDLQIHDGTRSFAWERLEFLHIPQLPKLKTMEICVQHGYSDSDGPQAAIKTTLFPDHSRALIGICAGLINRLRLASSLDLVWFCPLGEVYGQRGTPEVWAEHKIRGCIIRSFKHGDDELFHIRHHTYAIPLDEDNMSTQHDSDEEETDEEETDEEDEYTTAAYTHTDNMGLETTTTYLISEDLFWQDSTDYKGHIVPLEILRKMRKIEGVDEHDCTGRGIEMCEVAWDVLEKWYKKITKDERKGDAGEVVDGGMIGQGGEARDEDGGRQGPLAGGGEETEEEDMEYEGEESNDDNDDYDNGN